MSNDQFEFVLATTTQAREAGHPWPEYAACEAALESNYGESQLAREANNLFGMKAHHETPKNQVLSLPTKEFKNGQWLTTMAWWCKYATVADCFRDRLATLRRLAPSLLHYKEALEAQSGEAFVESVSLTWSTDPQRAVKVLSIHTQMEEEIARTPPTEPTKAV
jgi:flagellum-specific peptidoglycan hydrolase FlgJ